ncbi:MAG: hypothetical protein IKL65_05590 [Bacilli bacterium]|nr:hypothetical protein [Bacilli bacterium]MBR6690786.1 hypothetical protein [Bacilli bacterium]
MNDVIIKGFGEINNARKSKQSIYTSIKDEKVIFNLLNTECDFKLNECENKEIKVKNVLIKVIETPSENDEVVFKKITILIDDKDKSYVTASKMFANQLMDYLQNDIDKEFTIKIIKRSVKNSPNKALGFELV